MAQQITSEQLWPVEVGAWVLNEIGVSGSELEGGVRKEGIVERVRGKRHVWEGQREGACLGGGMSGRARVRRHASAGF